MGIKGRLSQIALKAGIIEDALHQAEDRFYKAFHASPAAMSITTRKGRYLDVNESFLTILGYRRDELIGHDPHELGIWVDPIARDRVIETLLRDGRADDHEARLRTRTGEVRDVEVAMELVVELGESCILTILEDVTERKRASAALKASEKRYREISELISDFAYSFVATPEGVLAKEWITASFSRITGIPTEDISTFEDLLAITRPDDRGEAEAHIAAALSGARDVRELRIVGSSGATKWLSFKTSPVVDPESGRVQRVYGAAEEITERVRARQTLEQRVAERTRELSVLLNVSYNVASRQELEPLLDLILTELKKLVDYSGAAILESAGDRLAFIEYRGPLPREEVMGLSIPRKDAAEYDKVITRREPVIIPDIWEGPRGLDLQKGPERDLYPAFGYAHSWLCAPLIAKDRIIGVLRLDHRDPAHFTEQHAALAMTMANQAAIAIENARLHDRERRLAALEERQRIARELHDSVSQALYGIKLGVQTAIKLLDDDSARLAEPLRYVNSLAEAGMVEMTALLYELRPEALETEGLMAGLEKHAEALRARHGIEVRTELGAEPEVSLKVKEAIYRIAREALNNIVRHAQATHVRIALSRGAGMIDLEIEDNGLGFDPAAVAPGYLGLHSMSERACQLGGSIEITSESGAGTRIRARIPAQA